jgi:hypothetical protein
MRVGSQRCVLALHYTSKTFSPPVCGAVASLLCLCVCWEWHSTVGRAPWVKGKHLHCKHTAKET